MTEQTTTTRVVPPADVPLTEQISSLVTRDTRAYLLGCVEADNARGEGAVLRALLMRSIAQLADADPDEHARRVALGEAELRRRGR